MVIAIIAVIAALSVPVMSKAYGVAAETRCVSNLRSLGQATAAYAADHHQKFPAGLGHTMNSVGGTAGAAGSSTHASNRPAEKRLLNRYLGDAHGVAVCPLDRGDQSYDSPTTAAYWGTSYLVTNNDYDFSFGTRAYACRFTRNGFWSLEGLG